MMSNDRSRTLSDALVGVIVEVVCRDYRPGSIAPNISLVTDQIPISTLI